MVLERHIEWLPLPKELLQLRLKKLEQMLVVQNLWKIFEPGLKVDFDKCVATPSMMEHVKKLSRNLKRLMPDAKKGTVTNDISQADKEAKEQSILFEKDKTAIVHVGLGKLSFTEDALLANIGAFVNGLLLTKPAGLKKSSKYAGYVDSFHICSTMAQSYPISIQSLSLAADRYTISQLQ